MNFPIGPDTPEMDLAYAIAEDLVIDGVDSMSALPIAIRLMSIIDQSHNDPNIGIKKIKENRRESDEWWVTYHPRTKHAKQAKLRLKK